MRSASLARGSAVIAILLLCGSCAASYTAVAKRNLDVQTRMSDTVFLEPVSPDKRTVYIDVRNTSDRPDFDVSEDVKDAVRSRGYQITDDPELAHYWLQANVLQAGRSSKTATESAYGAGFGGTIVGGAAGGGLGYSIGAAGGGNDILLGVGGALAGAAIEGVSGALVQDVTYTIVTDLQISERASRGVVVSESETSTISQGTSTSRVQTSSDQSDRKIYRTRVVSTANKANLAWEEAAPELVAGLERSIAGVF